MRHVQCRLDDEQGDDADRGIHEEHPAPARQAEDLRGAGEEAADQRPEDRGDAEDSKECALVLRALTRRNDVADDGQREGEETTSAEALERTVTRQLVHRVGKCAQQRAEDECADGEQEELLATVDVAELAVKRGGDGGGDEVRRRHPRLQGEPVQVVSDGADGGRHDRLIQSRQEHPHHQAREDRNNLAVGEVLRSVIVMSSGRLVRHESSIELAKLTSVAYGLPGEVAERPNAGALKASEGNLRGFKSLPRRQSDLTAPAVLYA